MARKNVTPEKKRNENSGNSLMLDLNQPLPLLPLRDSLVLPGTSSRLWVGRDISLAALREADEKHHGSLLLVMQKDSSLEKINTNDLHSVGVLARILQVTPMPKGYYKVLFEGFFAVDILEIKTNGDCWKALAVPRPAYFNSTEENKKQVAEILDLFRDYASRTDIPSDLLDSLSAAELPLQVYFSIVPFLRMSLQEKQSLLECLRLEDIAMKIESAIRALFDLEQTQKRIQSEVQLRMQQSQKDWLISEQIRLLQNELSHGDPSTDIDLLQEKLKAKNYSEEIQEKLNEEIARLRLMPPASPEYSQLHNYLEWFLALPYGVFSETDLNLRQVKKHLDERHFGLEKVKERILEYVSVLRLTKTERRAPVLCLVGPPGVGKTTLVASIAEAIGRQYVRVTLGGVRDEAEIRGHRRTYIGAMPGRFVQALRRAKCMNPVILLDEIDKMASDFRGDPASALLELLDPEQNRYFADHFMEVGLDFSRVLFIATANTEQDIPPALFDRLEVVRLPGYYKHEKIEIAEKHLLPEAATRSGVELGKNLSLSRELIEKIISDYTREAGVRELDRLLEKITRSRAKEIVLGKKIVPEVTEKLLTKYLGAPRFVNGKLPSPGRCGRITGLAWTSVGGEILNIECMLLSGRGRIALTGRLGDVMKESVQIALSLVRQRLKRYGVDPDIVRKTDIHIHVPEGAVPKDGPSAGIAMTLAILSAFTRIPVRPDIAFTGEVSLCGDLLPIGGLNEKSLAAKEAGVKTLYVPEGNGKDVLELPAPARKSLKIYQKKHIDEIVKELFPVPSSKA